jgi:hypothetical protein
MLLRSTAVLEAGRRSLDEDCTIEILYDQGKSSRSTVFSVQPVGLRRKVSKSA